MGRLSPRFALLAVLCITVGSGCGGSPSTSPVAVSGNGPLAGAEGNIGYCFPVRKGQMLTVGGPVLTVTGEKRVRVVGVTLEDNDGVELLDAEFVPLPGTTMFGTALGFPPTDESLSKDGLDAAWARRVGVGGDLSAHNPATKSPYNLVLGLRMTGEASSFKAVRIRYDVGSRHYELLSSTGVRSVPEGQTCK